MATATGFMMVSLRCDRKSARQIVIQFVGVFNPTDKRSRSPGHGEPSPSIEARCSIRLSTPPSEVARSAVRRRRPPRPPPFADADRKHAAETARHLPQGRVVTGMRFRARIERRRHRRMADQVSSRGSPPFSPARARAHRAFACRASTARNRRIEGPAELTAHLQIRPQRGLSPRPRARRRPRRNGRSNIWSRNLTILSRGRRPCEDRRRHRQSTQKSRRRRGRFPATAAIR